ncbi:MAG: hypothetical protein AAF928_08920 [Myxococcota bacterium]
MGASSRAAWWVGLAMALGCGRDGAPPAPGSGATVPREAAPLPSSSTVVSTAPELVPLDVRLGGRRIPFSSLLAYSRGGRAIQLMASTHALACGDLEKSAGIRAEAGEVTLALTVAPRLDPGGGETWSVGRVRYNQITRQGTYGKAEARGVDPKGDIDLTLDARLSVPGARGDLVIRGDVSVAGCGVVPLRRDALERAQTDLAVSVAGRTYPMRGATFEPSSPPKLRLSTEPHGCGSVAGSDLGLTITLAEKDNVATRIRLDGFVLPLTLAGKLDRVAAIPRQPLDGKDTLAIELQGDTKLGAYTLALRGIVNADICAETP